MGKKVKSKNKKSEFDDFFDKKKDDGWTTGVSAMEVLDGDTAAAEKGAGAGATAAMDTSEGGKSNATKGGLGVQKTQLKAVRGQRTKIQKHRKSKKAEHAAARADKTVVRLDVMMAHKQKKSGLKAIY